MFENNQGQEFEQVIEWANMAYYLKREAVIQKIAVPWKVERRFDYVVILKYNCVGISRGKKHRRFWRDRPR